MIGLATIDLPTALARLATALLGVALAWAALVAALASWRPTAHWARAITPRALRAAALTALSGTLAISPARAAGDLDGLPLPQRGATTTGAHVVAPGESLWAIAANRLGPDATAGAVAGSSRAWYLRNRDTIGPDPDVIRAGQMLEAPRPGDAR
ncbi:MAG: hypothetical protein ACJ71Z_08020 [Aeromicrobium sp.]